MDLPSPSPHKISIHDSLYSRIETISTHAIICICILTTRLTQPDLHSPPPNKISPHDSLHSRINHVWIYKWSNNSWLDKEFNTNKSNMCCNCWHKCRLVSSYSKNTELPWVNDNMYGCQCWHYYYFSGSNIVATDIAFPMDI